MSRFYCEGCMIEMPQGAGVCQDCCMHEEFDHDICLDCGYERDPGEQIDKAMDSIEEDR